MPEKTTKISLGFSPCPNDCFIFDAMVNGKINTEGLQFEYIMEDVEALNQKAFAEQLDITKLSFHAFAYLTGVYKLLNAGSALGFNCGPLLITNKEEVLKKLNGSNLNTQAHDIEKLKIAIPGKYTTANLLLSIAFPKLQNKTEYLFSSIEEAVLNNSVDAGLIIHENRFTYEQKGLKKIIDLGEFWEQLIKAPIPLGGIVVRRNLDNALQEKIDRVIRKSVEYAFAHPQSSMHFVKQHAQEMSEEVMKKHIQLYVNDYSVSLGEVGKNAIKLLFQKVKELNLVPSLQEDIFV